MGQDLKKRGWRAAGWLAARQAAYRHCHAIANIGRRRKLAPRRKSVGKLYIFELWLISVNYLYIYSSA
ncbi:MAG: hypothetical protein ACRCUI_12945 [Polymorphobacter sp.]